MDRLAYLVRRMLLVIPTFIGITIVCFSLTRFLPGGPVEMRMMRLKGLGAQSGETAGSSNASASQVSEAYKKQLDSLFANQALDIETDIAVMNSMLDREGLSDRKDFVIREEPKGQVAAGGGASR